MKTPQPERRSAEFVADVVGYSGLIEADEAGTLAAMRHLRHSLLEPLLAEHHGRIFKLTGDGFLAEFAFSVDAVACAVAVQTRIAERDKQSFGRRLVLRIGVHVGDVVVEDDDLVGHHVNIAARLEEICPPGGVMISSIAHDEIQDKLDIRFESAGEQRLKNIARPYWVYQMACLNGVAPIVSSRPLDSRPLIVVMQFASDFRQRDLSYGISVDIVTCLSRDHSLHSTSSNFSFRSRSSSMDKGAVGRRLGARFLLDGRIWRSDSALHIAAELSETTTNQILWSERYVRGVEELFRVETELASAIAATVEAKIAESGAELARQKLPEERDALDWLQLGRYYASRYQAFEAAKSLRQAIRLDQTCAQAHAWAAVVEFFKYFRIGRIELLERALKLAERSIVLDQADAFCRLSLGLVYMQMKRPHEASIHIERAVEMAPTDTIVSSGYSLLLCLTGHPKEALQKIRAARKANRFPPEWCLEIEGICLFELGSYDEAVRVLSQISQPQWWTLCYLAAALVLSGSPDQAKLVVALIFRQMPHFEVRVIARTETYNDFYYLQHLQEGTREAVSLHGNGLGYSGS